MNSNRITMGSLRMLSRALLLLVFALPATLQGQFQYTAIDGRIIITLYTGPAGDVEIPERIDGLPVTRLIESRSIG